MTKHASLTRRQAAEIVLHAIPYFDQINDALDGVPDLARLPDKQMVLVLLPYITAIAKHTKLNVDDLLTLAVAAYDLIETQRKGDEAPKFNDTTVVQKEEDQQDEE